MNLKALLQEKHTGVGEDVGLEEGCKMVNAYREANPKEIPGHFIGKDILMRILAQPDCVGITFRKGLNEAGEEHLVYTGIGKDGKDILTYSVVTTIGDIEVREAIVGDRTIWDWTIFTDPPKPKPKPKPTTEK